MKTATKEVMKFGRIYGTILKCTEKHTYVRFNNHDMPRLQSKEDYIDSQLQQWVRDEKIPMYTSRNKKINGCSARPDFVYNLATHLVVLEVDEFQHSKTFNHHAVYKPREEFQRMHDLCSAAQKPVVMLRYNPDAFQVDGETRLIETADRVALLLERLEYYLKLPVSDNFIMAEYLFYSRSADPLIGCFSFPDSQSMCNWIELFGASWDTSTLWEAVECAQLKLQAGSTTDKKPPHASKRPRNRHDTSSESLCTQYKNTTIEMFDAWPPAQRALYASEKMVDAYNRLNRFRLYGPNHTVALANLKARYIHDSVSTHDVNLITMADLHAGVQRGHYDYLAYAMLDEMLRMYTGVGDPYQVNTIFQSVIWNNLECSLNGKRMIVSMIKSRAIFALYTRWIALDPLHHTPSQIVHETDSLDFKHAMTIFNQILRFMNMLELIDSNQQKRRSGEIPDRLLIMDKYSYFAEEVDSTDKPALDQWTNGPSFHPAMHHQPSKHAYRTVVVSHKRKRGEPRQMMTMEKREDKKRKRKEHNEKLFKIRRMAERRELAVDRRMAVAFLMD